MANITWLKRKDFLKDKLLKILQPNHQDSRRVRILFFFLDFIGNSPSAGYQNGQISIFTAYTSGPSDELHRPIPTLCIFWFLPNRPLPLYKNHLSWHVLKNDVNTSFHFPPRTIALLWSCWVNELVTKTSRERRDQLIHWKGKVPTWSFQSNFTLTLQLQGAMAIETTTSLCPFRGNCDSAVPSLDNPFMLFPG